MKTATQIAFEAATDKNDHTGATQILCIAMIEKMPGASVFPAYMIVLGSLAATSDAMGHMPQNLQTMRDAIQADLLWRCKMYQIIA